MRFLVCFACVALLSAGFFTGYTVGSFTTSYRMEREAIAHAVGYYDKQLKFKWEEVTAPLSIKGLTK